jgi:transposase InsO family protein
MDIDITNAAKSSQSCTEILPSLPHEPLIQYQEATRPFQQLHSDLATINGHDFLIIADQYSGWLDVIPFPNKNTTAARRVVDAVREFFVRGLGAPDKFWSGNGPQFNAVEFKDFARDWGISVGNSAPHYPQSNGFAEAAISSMKKLIASSWRKGSFDVNQFAKSILLFRNAPCSPLQRKWCSIGQNATKSAES